MNYSLAPHFPAITDNPVQSAFRARTPIMPGQNKRALPCPQWREVWQQVERTPPRSGKRLVYVHIPFCINHCLYCGFYRNRYRPEESAPYVELLTQEILRESLMPIIGSEPIHAVYFGGGTPSALEASDLARLIETLRSSLPLAPDCEVTLEGRIAHFDDNKIDACFNAGVNRLSIGVQSFDSQVRQQQGRRASGADAAEFIARRVADNRGTIVIDLLYGLPWQTPEVWQNDLETCIALAPDGVDIYALKLFPGTPLDRAIAHGRVPPVATLSEQGALYVQATEALSAAGWRQISNSHWARTTRERNLYNLLIKGGAETLAYGSGGGGSIEPYSYSNTAELAEYARIVQQGRKPLSEILVADDLQPLRAIAMGSIEVGRLDLKALFAAAPSYLKQAAEQVETLVERWIAAGLAERQGSIVTTTRAGRFWAPNLIAGLQAVYANAATSAQRSADESVQHLDDSPH